MVQRGEVAGQEDVDHEGRLYEAPDAAQGTRTQHRPAGVELYDEVEVYGTPQQRLRQKVKDEAQGRGDRLGLEVVA